MNRNLSILTVNQFLTNMADSIFQIVLFWYIYHQTGSALSASLVTAISFTIQIFAAPIIGVFADRLQPKRSILLSFLLLGSIGILFVPFHFLSESFTIIYIYTAVIIHTCCMMFETSSKTRLIPLFTGPQNIIKTNGYLSSAGNLAELLGSSFGGALLAVLSLTSVMLIHSGFYFLAGLLLLFLVNAKQAEPSASGEKPAESADRPSFFQDLLDSLKLIKTNRPLGKFIILSSVLNISMLNASLLVVLVSSHYHGSSAAFGLFTMFGVLSSILIGLAITPLTSRLNARTLLTSGLLLNGAATLMMGITDWMIGGILLNMLVFASGSVLRITFQSFMILCVEDRFRGRMMSLAIAISAVVVPLVSLLGGYLSDHFSVGLVYILSGTWILMWALFPLLDRDLRTMDLSSRTKPLSL
ncbi:MFS transporter [Bacillus massiliglaciei]|uniref:MFS transporter n=1 Tax=Bacillus massiliglaciei TaxID=1816693 RepID=UPI000DA61A4B|nr:MFS transporter [Bacillus massiliglaciei]